MSSGADFRADSAEVENDRQNRWTALPFLNSSSRAEVSRKTFGALLLLIIVFLWTASNFLCSSLYRGKDPEYFKSFLVTYLNTSTFTLYLIPFALKWTVRRQTSWNTYGSLLQGDASQKDVLSTKDTFYVARDFCILWFLANFLSSVSFRWIPVASGTILSSLSSIFCAIIGNRYGVERLSGAKAVAIGLSLTGVIIISSTDIRQAPNLSAPQTSSASNLSVGYVCALFGAIFYGFYSVLLKVKLGDESRIDMKLFFGFVGVVNLLCLWPGLLIFHILGFEPLELPPNTRVVSMVVINAAITFISELLWGYAILYTTPLTVTIGLGLSIPLSILGEMVLDGVLPSLSYWIGAGLVFLSFFYINKEEEETDSVTASD